MEGRRTAVGGLGGAVATAAMTGWMAVGQRTGPYGEQTPKRLVRRVARRAGIPARRRGRGTRLASGAAHLGFGVSCGALYGATGIRSTVPRGVLFGLGVWAASYAGWIPALGLMPPPARDNPRRAWTMMSAHVIYGAVLGGVLAGWDRTAGSTANTPSTRSAAAAGSATSVLEEPR